MDLKGRTMLFDRNDVIENSEFSNYAGHVMVLGQNALKRFLPEYQKAEFQLFLAEGGFGASVGTLGNAVYGKFIADGEKCRQNRGDFIGILKPELVEKYEIELKKQV